MGRGWASSELDHSALAQAGVSVAGIPCPANDDVIEDVDFHDLGGVHQLTGHADILRAGRWVSARVVVCQYNGGGSVLYSGSEYFARVYQRGVKGSEGDQVPVDQKVFGVQCKDQKNLLRSVADIL